MKIAIVKTSALGDIIHASFIPSLLKKHLPNTQIHWVVTKDLAEILANHPDIDHIVTLPYRSQANAWHTLLGLWQFARQKHDAYDYVFDLQSLLKSALISFLLPGKRIGFSFRGCRESFASFSYHNCHDIAYSENIFTRNLFLFTEQLKPEFKPSDKNASKHLHYTKQALLDVKEYLQPKRKNILLIPGASRMKKVYAPARYAKIVDNLSAEKHHIIVAWGNAKEQQLAQEIKDQCQTNHPNILPKRLPFDALKALIDSVDIVIGSDTGPVHMAWALKTPSIVLFATNNPASAERNHDTTAINKALSATSMHSINTSCVLSRIQLLLASTSESALC